MGERNNRETMGGIAEGTENGADKTDGSEGLGIEEAKATIANREGGEGPSIG